LENKNKKRWRVKRGQDFKVTVWSIMSQAVEMEGAPRFGHIINSDLRRAEWRVQS